MTEEDLRNGFVFLVIQGIKADTVQYSVILVPQADFSKTRVPVLPRTGRGQQSPTQTMQASWRAVSTPVFRNSKRQVLFEP